jgi:penicillin-binding protein 2D
MIAIILVALISGVIGYVLWTVRDMPDPGQVPELAHSLVIYDRKNREIAQINGQGEYYQSLMLPEMGDANKWATLAAEDRDFYSHPAIDLASTLRAAGSDALHRGNLQGGSTITQQLVKISVLTPQRSVFRKMQEATIAIGLESKYSKDKILEMYLNRVSYGHNAYGVGAAAKIYFAKDAKDLSAGQAAFLAGLINGPSYYDPAIHYDRAKERQAYVLDGMVKTGKLSQADADKAAGEDIKSQLKFVSTFGKGKAPHFVQWVREQLEKALGKDAAQGGYKVYTTLDLDLQDLAMRSVQQGAGSRRLQRMGINNGDLLAAKPDTGEILAWVGSANFDEQDIGGEVDRIQERHQPGSSFKPYVFEAALKDHTITLATTLHDRPTDFGRGPKWPVDFDNSYMGDISARTSLVESRNIPAVELAQKEGIDKVISQARSQGVKSNLKPQLQTAIGGSEVTMLDNLQGYQTFANQGMMVPLRGITKIVNVQTNEEFQLPGDPSSRAMNPNEAYLVTDVLKDYNRRWGLGWKRQMAGKSGTAGGDTQGINSDAWMMAYSPDIVVGAWAGHTTEHEGSKPVTAFGVNVGQEILAPFINGLPSSMNNWYKRPDGIVTGSGCAGDHSSGAAEIFLTGTQGGVSCPTPTPTPPPTPTPSPSQTPVPTIAPTRSPSPGPSPSPSPSPTH